MSGWLTSEGITVPTTISPGADAGLALQQNFQILGLRSAAILGPCRAASGPADGNIALANLQTIDGVVLAAGDRVLLTQQTTKSQNGPWQAVNSGPWTRPTDFNSDMVFTTGGLLVPVIGGTVNGGYTFILGVYSASGPVGSGSGNLIVDTSPLGVIILPTGIAAVVDDTTPELGGNLNVNGYEILAPDNTSGVYLGHSLGDGAYCQLFGNNQGSSDQQGGAEFVLDGTVNESPMLKVSYWNGSSWPDILEATAYNPNTESPTMNMLGNQICMNDGSDSGGGILNMDSGTIFMNGGSIYFDGGAISSSGSPGYLENFELYDSSDTMMISNGRQLIDSDGSTQVANWGNGDGILHLPNGLNIGSGAATCDNGGDIAAYSFSGVSDAPLNAPNGVTGSYGDRVAFPAGLSVPYSYATYLDGNAIQTDGNGDLAITGYGGWDYSGTSPGSYALVVAHGTTCLDGGGFTTDGSGNVTAVSFNGDGSNLSGKYPLYYFNPNTQIIYANTSVALYVDSNGNLQLFGFAAGSGEFGGVGGDDVSSIGFDVNGYINLWGLPASDPGTAGTLYTQAGVLMVSAG